MTIHAVLKLKFPDSLERYVAANLIAKTRSSGP